MSHVVETIELGKRYRLGTGALSYSTLAETLTRSFRVRRPERPEDPVELWALRNLDFEVVEGEAVGIIGRNGAGKSTLLKILTGITAPTAGLARTRGRIGSLLEVGTGFHLELTGRENVFLNAALLGMSRRDTRRRFDEIVAFAGVEAFLDTPLKRYSSGMALRLAFAVAAHLEPDILLVDEVLAVGDAEFQRRCLGRIADLEQEQRTVIFVSHDLGTVARLCSRVVWLDRGGIVETGPPGPVIERYLRSGISRGTSTTVSNQRVRRLTVNVSSEGRPVDTPFRGYSIAFEFDFELSEPLPGLDVGAYIVSSDGARVLSEALSDEARPRPPMSMRGKVTLVIPPVLTPGDYALGVWLGNEYEDAFLGEVVQFTVMPRPEDSDVMLTRERVIQPQVRWTVNVDE